MFALAWGGGAESTTSIRYAHEIFWVDTPASCEDELRAEQFGKNYASQVSGLQVTLSGVTTEALPSGYGALFSIACCQVVSSDQLVQFWDIVECLRAVYLNITSKEDDVSLGLNLAVSAVHHVVSLAFSSLYVVQTGTPDSIPGGWPRHGSPASVRHDRKKTQSVQQAAQYRSNHQEEKYLCV